MKEPIFTQEYAEAFTRNLLDVVPAGGTVTRAEAARFLNAAFRDKASWTHQKETAEMLLSVLVAVGIFERIDHSFLRVR